MVYVHVVLSGLLLYQWTCAKNEWMCHPGFHNTILSTSSDCPMVALDGWARWAHWAHWLMRHRFTRNVGWRHCPLDSVLEIMLVTFVVYLSVQNQLFRSLSHLWSTYTLCNPMVSKTTFAFIIFPFFSLLLFYLVLIFCGLVTGPGPCTYTHCR